MSDNFSENKKQINEKHLSELMDMLSTPEGRTEACKPIYPSTNLYAKRSQDRSKINEEKAKYIYDQISTPEGRMILEAHMWNPMPRGWDRCRSDETELEWAKRVMERLRKSVNESRKGEK